MTDWRPYETAGDGPAEGSANRRARRRGGGVAVEGDASAVVGASPRAATVPQATLRQVVRSLRGALAAEVMAPGVWPPLAAVLHEAEAAPLAFVAAQQERQAAARPGEVQEVAVDDEMDDAARFRAARVGARAR